MDDDLCYQYELISDDDGDDDLKMVNMTPMYMQSELIQNDGKATLTSPSQENVQIAYNLDVLLHEAREERKMEEINANLQKGIKLGGVKSLRPLYDALEDVQLRPEQLEELRQFDVCNEIIKKHAPGENILKEDKFGQLFHYPDTLSLASCGFIAGSGQLDSCLMAYSHQPDMLLEFITCDIITLCFESLQTPHQFLDWLFLLMSEIEDYDVCLSLHRTIHLALHKTVGKATDWVPSLLNICRVFVNYGAKFEDITPHKSLLYFSANSLYLNNSLAGAEQIEDEDCSLDNVDNGQLDIQRHHPRIANIDCILKTIATALTQRDKFYTEDDLSALFLLLLKVFLDRSFTDFSLWSEFQQCVAALLQAFNETAWMEKVLHLCLLAGDLTKHPHNQINLLICFPATVRGVYCKRWLGYVMLNKFFLKTIDENDLRALKVSDMYEIVSNLRNQEVTDIYRIWAIVKMVDFCVGMGDFDDKDWLSLHDLCLSLDSYQSTLRDTIHQLDNTTVKNMMHVISIKWRRMLQTSKVNELLLNQHYALGNTCNSSLPEVLESNQSNCNDDSSDSVDDDELKD